MSGTFRHQRLRTYRWFSQGKRAKDNESEEPQSFIFNEAEQESVMFYQIQVKGLVGSNDRSLKEEQDIIAKAYAGAVVANDDVFVVHLLRFKCSLF